MEGVETAEAAGEGEPAQVLLPHAEPLEQQQEPQRDQAAGERPVATLAERSSFERLLLLPSMVADHLLEQMIHWLGLL